ncbi:MAG: nickel pincer cofactor biosynthesis protein LarC [Lachnospiraceae bacterium]|nr:nickel pincer cofactor biosynthesis protein LarC [Lachnospiraceae bacterium]MDU3181600.1 nickel pincer cofactor biosynthesis protein LarC [Lachnospiraceae bacterium]
MNKQKLYLECYSGISGDMTVAALLDLGADKEVLNEALNSLSISGQFQTKISRVSKAGLDACDFDVILEQENHDHDMQYLHGHGHTHEHEHTHDHEHTHSHGHEHHHHHEHRGLIEIQGIIRCSKMTDRAKELAEKIFDILANAEAKAHGKPKTEVHFHEVGAVDSIVDIAAVAICLDNLGIDEVIIPTLYEGCGTVRCQHGVLPIPVPAVANIVNAENLTLHITDTEGEFVTPTGAAIAAAIRTADKLPENFRILRTGIGAGKRNYERPSLLRVMLIEEQDNQEVEKDEIVKMESNIDDCTGEALGYTMEKLMEAGARDVHYFPVFMKKNRPGYQLNVICKENQISQLQKIIFEETTSIGIRIQHMERSVLPRRIEIRDTSMGEVQVKICTLPSGERIYPEHESIAKICKESGRSWQEVYRQIIEECQ